MRVKLGEALIVGQVFFIKGRCHSFYETKGKSSRLKFEAGPRMGTQDMEWAHDSWVRAA